MTRLFCFCGLILSLVSCSPRMIVSTSPLAGSIQSPATVAPATGFLVIAEDEPFSGPAEELGDIIIRDSGLTLVCDYETVVGLASDKARALGANALRIYEHRQPSMWLSSCHQIRAKALRLPDLTPYEREVVWLPGRPLKLADFKGSLENRPFQAATSSSIRYRYTGLGLGKIRFIAETYFSCPDSYFKPSKADSAVLAHEQVHFDITELHARRFVQQLQKQVANSRELEQKHAALFKQLLSDCQIMQDAYDTEAYADYNRVTAWQQRLAHELAALQPYADKTLTFKVAL